MPKNYLTDKEIKLRLPKRPSDANKSTFGKVLVIAGSQSYPGASFLVCSAIYRVGAGLVKLATVKDVYQIIGKQLKEVTFLVLGESDGVISAKAFEQIKEELPIFDVLVVGPGLGQEDKTLEFFKKLLTFLNDQRKIKVLIDADGLNFLSKMEKWWEKLNLNGVLTPHPGEMSRLVGKSIEEVQSDREKMAKDLALKSHQVVVLKGAHTVIASPDGKIAQSPFANPSLATAGTGDILTGIIAGFIAQRLDPFDAACVGVYIHALAGEQLRKGLGDAGVLASDLLPLLPKAINQLKNHTPGV